jgi:hypothetical protein
MIDNPPPIIHAMSRIPTLQVQILAIASPAMGHSILKDLRVYLAVRLRLPHGRSHSLNLLYGRVDLFFGSLSLGLDPRSSLRFSLGDSLVLHRCAPAPRLLGYVFRFGVLVREKFGLSDLLARALGLRGVLNRLFFFLTVIFFDIPFLCPCLFGFLDRFSIIIRERLGLSDLLARALGLRGVLNRLVFFVTVIFLDLLLLCPSLFGFLDRFDLRRVDDLATVERSLYSLLVLLG